MRKNSFPADGGGLPTVGRTRPIVLYPDLIARFWLKVDQSAGRGACWLWTGKTQNGGYGVIHRGGKQNDTPYVHRLSWMISGGADPVGWAVCHHCDNPTCVNPNHLFLGSIADNVHDMIAKGRKAAHIGSNVPRGEQASSAKLTEVQVREILLRSSKGEGSGSLGLAFRVDSSTIRQIVRREIWRHVEVAS